MKILVVEDRGSVLYPLLIELEKLGHDVLTALDVAQARAVWNGGNSDIACIIVDTNIPADRRAKDTIEEKNRNSVNKEWHALAGWIWLEQEGLVGRITPMATGVPKVIIYSAFLDDWHAQGCRENDYPHIRFFRKGPDTAQNLLDHVKAIAAQGERIG